MKRGMPSLFKAGTSHLSGLEEAIIKNLQACKALSTITRTSLGPNGMNKLVINHLEKIIVTSDCATIVKELEIQHPAAKMLELAAEMQEQVRKGEEEEEQPQQHTTRPYDSRHPPLTTLLRRSVVMPPTLP